MRHLTEFDSQLYSHAGSLDLRGCEDEFSFPVRNCAPYCATHILNMGSTWHAVRSLASRDDAGTELLSLLNDPFKQEVSPRTTQAPRPTFSEQETLTCRNLARRWSHLVRLGILGRHYGRNCDPILFCPPLQYSRLRPKVETFRRETCAATHR